MLGFTKKKKDNKMIRLYDAYRNMLYDEAYRILMDEKLSEDAVHETFERIMNSLHKIDDENSKKTASFLLVVCRNVAYNIYNSRKLNSFQQDGDFADSLADKNIPYGDVSDIVIENESMRILADKIKLLKPKYQEIILMRYYHDLSYEQISQLIGISQETARKRAERGRKMLKDILKRSEEFEQ